MGDLAAVVTVAVGSGGVASVLAGSLSTWLSRRRRETTVKVTFPDGRSVEVTNQGPDEPEALLRAVLEHAPRPD